MFPDFWFMTSHRFPSLFFLIRCSDCSLTCVSRHLLVMKGNNAAFSVWNQLMHAAVVGESRSWVGEVRFGQKETQRDVAEAKTTQKRLGLLSFIAVRSGNESYSFPTKQFDLKVKAHNDQLSVVICYLLALTKLVSLKHETFSS